MQYEMKIAGLTRALPLCPISDTLYIGAFIMFSDTELTIAAAKELLKKAPDFDVIITAESKGIPLAYEMSRQSGKPYVVARKGEKLYMEDVIKTEVNSITTAHTQTLCVGKREREIMENRRILIVDDVISTGASLAVLEAITEKAGGNIVGKLAVLAEGDAINREDILYLEPLPLFDKNGAPIR